MADILDRILAAQRDTIRKSRNAVPLNWLERAVDHAPRPRDFRAALTRGDPISLIAEIKRASPSKGLLAANLSAADTAKVYEKSGAHAISVLTEKPHFHGSLDDLAAAHNACSLPLLRKDFLIDPYQIWESRAHGADAILLIARLLEPEGLSRLIELTHDLGMEALVEVHTESEIERIRGTGYRILGINNRDLSTFTIDLSRTRKLAATLPDGIIKVAESGIETPADVETVRTAGADAILVGEALVTADDPGIRIAQLLGRKVTQPT